MEVIRKEVINMKDRLKALRVALGLTQQELADGLKIHRGMISKYELGVSAPASSVISLICAQYGVNETWLRTGEGEMFAPDEEDDVAALVRDHGLNPVVAALIRRLVALPAREQEVVARLLQDTATAVARMEEPEAEPQKEEELSIDEKVERYRRMLELEKKPPEGDVSEEVDA
jgi:transcriptional regulator with XRE-family HTH domain